jgi:hypothetical protein
MESIQRNHIRRLPKHCGVYELMGEKTYSKKELMNLIGRLEKEGKLKTLYGFQDSD